MIPVKRPSPPPELMKSRLRRHEQERTREWFSKHKKKGDQQPFDFSRSAKEIHGFMNALRELFANKCAYCEMNLNNSSIKNTLSFFRPRQKAEQSDGTVAWDRYWWLSWEWSNLYLACPLCIHNKGRKFPTEDGNRAKPGTYGDMLQKEKPLLLDPCLDDPSKHLFFEETGDVTGITPNGLTTVGVLKLNRDQLRSARSDSARKTRDILNECLKAMHNNGGVVNANTVLQIKELESRCNDDQEFAGMTRQLLQRWLKKGLPSTTHQTPYASLGVSPWHEFLKKLADYEANLLKTTFYTCFISYSNYDFKFGEKLCSDLEIKGVGYWFAPEQMKIGDKILPTIKEAIHKFDKLLVILSKKSMQSKWVKLEVDEALKIERSQNRRLILFPIFIDKDVMNIRTGWVSSIKRERHIGDFSKWKNHSDYQQSLDRLLRDLKP